LTTTNRPRLKDAFVTTGNPQRIAAALTNLEEDEEARERIIVGHGPAGRGKTTAGIWLAGHDPRRRIYLRALEVWDGLTMMRAIARELGKDTLPSLSGRAYEALQEAAGLTERTTWVIDEANYLKRRPLNILRDLHDSTRLTLVFLGEEKIKTALEQHTRFRSRVAAWVPFVPLTEAEAPLVAGKLLPEGMGIEGPAAKAIHAAAQGSFREYVNHLRAALRVAGANGQISITPETVRTLGLRMLRAA